MTPIFKYLTTFVVLYEEHVVKKLGKRQKDREKGRNLSSKVRKREAFWEEHHHL